MASMPDSPDTRGKGGASKRITHGSHLVKGKSNHAMEDCLVCEFKQVHNNDLGLFAIYDGHMGHDVANYLQTHLFNNILKEVMHNSREEFVLSQLCPDNSLFVHFRYSVIHITCICEQHDVWTDTVNATRRAYHSTDRDILAKAFELGKGGSTAVTAMLINSQTLIVANVGDSRAVISKKGVAEQLSVDHEPNREREIIESKGGFVSNIPGNDSSFSLSGL